LHGFRTVVVCQRGREKTYSKYYKKRGEKGIIDEIILVDKFKDIVKKSVQEKLTQDECYFFTVTGIFGFTVNYKEIEDKFMVPMFG